MVEIIEHNDYNAKINDTTVAWLDYIGLDGKTYIVKGFKYTESIWVVPEVVGISKEDVKKTGEAFKAINYNHLETPEEKTKYLQDMNILFKRINHSKLGSKFLEELNYTFPVGTTPTLNIIKNYKDKPNHKIKEKDKIPLISTIIIQGHYNVGSCFARGSLNGKRKTYSSLIMGTNFLQLSLLHTNNQYFFHDPAVILFHELTHILHRFHDTKSKHKLKGLTYTLEEIITTGGAERLIYKAKIQSLAYELLESRKSIMHDMNSNIKNNAISLEEIEYIARKYNFRYSKKQLTTNETLNREYLNKILHEFTEINFAKELNTPYRLVYKQRRVEVCTFVDLQDPTMYSIENGLTKKIFTPGEGFQPIIHPNTNISDEDLKLPLAFLKENWIENDINLLGETIKEFEPTAVIVKSKIDKNAKKDINLPPILPSRNLKNTIIIDTLQIHPEIGIAKTVESSKPSSAKKVLILNKPYSLMPWHKIS